MYLPGRGGRATDDLGLKSRSGHPWVDTKASFTLRERWDHLQGASLFFLFGTLLLAYSPVALRAGPFLLISPGALALFVFGWIYLAGASSEDRVGWALFLASVIVGVSALVAFAWLVLPPDSSAWLLYLLLGPYVPMVYAPMVSAHAVLFVYLSARFAHGHKAASIMIHVGSLALAIAAIVGLLAEDNDLALPFVFMPLGYGLVALGVWQGTRSPRR